LRWLLDAQSKIGHNPSDAELEKYVKDTLAAGKVIPGYGHAVLREVDPRYQIQIKFGDKFLPNDDLFKLVYINITIGKTMFQNYSKSTKRRRKSCQPMAKCRLQFWSSFVSLWIKRI
jgi:citrate synthase